MTTNDDNLRKFPRVDATFAVDYEMNDKPGRTGSLNLGGGGIFMGIAQPLEPGTEIKLRFRAAKHLPIIEARAQIRYHVPGKGVGLEFIGIDDKDRERILRLVHHRDEDQRTYPRVPLASQVEHDGGSFIGFSKDISTGGMFVETKDTLPPGAALRVRFNLDEGPICKAAGEVRYEVTRLGIGLRFTHISPEDQKRIEAYVARLATK
jgi:uncharacterized protein (TIGR02266 family)